MRPFLSHEWWWYYSYHKLAYSFQWWNLWALWTFIKNTESKAWVKKKWRIILLLPCPWEKGESQRREEKQAWCCDADRSGSLSVHPKRCTGYLGAKSPSSEYNRKAGSPDSDYHPEKPSIQSQGHQAAVFSTDGARLHEEPKAEVSVSIVISFSNLQEEWNPQDGQQLTNSTLHVSF